MASAASVRWCPAHGVRLPGGLPWVCRRRAQRDAEDGRDDPQDGHQAHWRREGRLSPREGPSTLIPVCLPMPGLAHRWREMPDPRRATMTSIRTEDEDKNRQKKQEPGGSPGTNQTRRCRGGSTGPADRSDAADLGLGGVHSLDRVRLGRPSVGAGRAGQPGGRDRHPGGSHARPEGDGP